MQIEQIKIAIKEAERFIKLGNELIKAKNISRTYGEHTFYNSAPKESGALRRSSLDLTRQLAKMRKPF
jgi:hypothetical protein